MPISVFLSISGYGCGVR